MSDQLREALENHGCVSAPHSEDDPADECGVCTIDAAARRFLALTETGPDYEAARRAFELEFPCHCGPAFTDRDRHASDCVFDESDSVIPIVDAALADYLTEEDR